MNRRALPMVARTIAPVSLGQAALGIRVACRRSAYGPTDCALETSLDRESVQRAQVSPCRTPRAA
jgi:hypothetical protein